MTSILLVVLQTGVLVTSWSSNVKDLCFEFFTGSKPGTCPLSIGPLRTFAQGS